MDLQLRGKRALVTGSTAGIGLAAAAGLSREGASVVVNGRTSRRVDEAVARLRGLGGDGLGFCELKELGGEPQLRRYLPAMKRRDWGWIVFVSSESGVQIPVE